LIEFKCTLLIKSFRFLFISLQRNIEFAKTLAQIEFMTKAEEYHIKAASYCCPIFQHKLLLLLRTSFRTLGDHLPKTVQKDISLACYSNESDFGESERVSHFPRTFLKHFPLYAMKRGKTRVKNKTTCQK